MLNHHCPVQTLIGPPQFNRCHDLLYHESSIGFLVPIDHIVSGVPAGQLGDDLLAILVSTNGDITIFPSKMHVPAEVGQLHTRTLP